MIHFLNSTPKQQSDWQLLEAMLSIGDTVFLYEAATKLLNQADAIPVLLTWVHKGIKLVVLESVVEGDVLISQSLDEHISVVSWDMVVDLVVESEGVQAL